MAQMEVCHGGQHADVRDSCDGLCSVADPLVDEECGIPGPMDRDQMTSESNVSFFAAEASACRASATYSLRRSHIVHIGALHVRRPALY
jgi:hypothetical protein